MDLLLFALVRPFLDSFKVVVEEEEEEFPCEGAGGCCEDRARDDLRGDIVRRKQAQSTSLEKERLRWRGAG